MTTLPPSPTLPNGSYQETTQGPVGSCITPSVTLPSSIGASTPTLSICSSTGATPSTGAGVGAGSVVATGDAARMTGPGRRAPVLGTSDSASVVVTSASSSWAATSINGTRSPSKSAMAIRGLTPRATL